MTEYEYEYYSAFPKWPNTNTNTSIRPQLFEYYSNTYVETHAHTHTNKHTQTHTYIQFFTLATGNPLNYVTVDLVLQNLFEEEELEEEDSDVDSDAYEGDESESDDDED